MQTKIDWTRPKISLCKLYRFDLKTPILETPAVHFLRPLKHGGASVCRRRSENKLQ